MSCGRYLVYFFFGGFLLPSNLVFSLADWSSSSSSNVEPMCFYRGVPHPFFEEFRVDECTTCVCEHMVTCTIEACQAVQCTEPVKRPGECCQKCNYDVRVQKVSPMVTAQNPTDKLIRLRVPIEFDETANTTGVEGTNLWTLSGWVTLDHANSSKGYDYQGQLLSVEDRSKTYEHGREFVFEIVEFRLTHRAIACHGERPFSICVRFDQDPDHEVEQDVDFKLSGEPDNSFLTGCTSTQLPAEWCTPARSNLNVRNDSTRLDGRVALVMPFILRMLLSLY